MIIQKMFLLDITSYRKGDPFTELYARGFSDHKSQTAEDLEYDNLLKENSLMKERQVVDKLLSLEMNNKEEAKGLILLAERVITASPVNYVFTIDTKMKLNVAQIVERAQKERYDVKSYSKFTGVRLKINELKGKYNLKYTLMFFKSGKINCLGIKERTLEQIDLILADAKRKISFLVRGLSEEEFSESFKLVNCVLSVKIPKSIDLKHLYLFNELKKWKNIKYNNQLFPGVITKPENLKVRINFFCTGSAIFTGVKDYQCRIESLKIFLTLINEYLHLLKERKLKEQ